MMFSIALIFTLLVAGNAVLSTTFDMLYSLYAQRLSGDLTVSPTAESNFTIFGSDQMLVGSYLTPPTLVGFDTLKQRVEAYPQVRQSAGLISSAARVEVGKKRQDLLLFGVDFEDYSDLVTGLEIDEGTFPAPGEHGILVQQGHFKDPVGKKALLTSGLGRNFTIREVPVAGTFSYPVDDKSLNTIALVDVETTRALNGYLYGMGEGPQLSEEEQQALSDDFSDMFQGTDNATDDTGAVNVQPGEDSAEDFAGDRSAGNSPADSAINPEALFSKNKAEGLENGTDPGSDPATDPGDEKKGATERPSTETEDNAWNFLLVSLHDRQDIERVSSLLASEGYTKDNGFRVRDWSSSVGGNAQLAYYLQLLFNIGLLFVSFGAAIIAANALLLSILERREEIGTLRAVGATRSRVALLIFFETLLIVFASALVGIALGAYAVGRLNQAALIPENQYITLLFGGNPIRGQVTAESLMTHLLAAFLLTIVSMLYPLKKALSISPVEAMAE